MRLVCLRLLPVASYAFVFRNPNAGFDYFVFLASPTVLHWRHIFSSVSVCFDAGTIDSALLYFIDDVSSGVSRFCLAGEAFEKEM